MDLRRNSGLLLAAVVLFPCGLFFGPWVIFYTWAEWRMYVDEELPVPEPVMTRLIIGLAWLIASITFCLFGPMFFGLM